MARQPKKSDGEEKLETVEPESYTITSRVRHERGRINFYLYQIVAGVGAGTLSILFATNQGLPFNLGLNPTLFFAILTGVGVASLMLAAIAAIRSFLDYGGTVKEVYSTQFIESPPSINHRPNSETSESNAIAKPPLSAKDSLALEMRSRLREEVRDQGRKASTNLASGAVLALVGAGFLIWLAFDASSRIASTTTVPNSMLYWGALGSKIALSVTANAFAFFFLSTYRRNLSEIKYFQNELTNIESRLLGLCVSQENNAAGIERIVLELIGTERNFILKKGETTTDLSLKNMDQGDVQFFASMVSKAIDANSRKPE